jgi:hypothetical protein
VWSVEYCAKSGLPPRSGLEVLTRRFVLPTPPAPCLDLCAFAALREIFLYPADSNLSRQLDTGHALGTDVPYLQRQASRDVARVQ